MNDDDDYDEFHYHSCSRHRRSRRDDVGVGTMWLDECPSRQVSPRPTDAATILLAILAAHCSADAAVAVVVVVETNCHSRQKQPTTTRMTMSQSSRCVATTVVVVLHNNIVAVVMMS